MVLPEVIPMVDENMGTQYGSESFEVFQKQYVNKTSNNILTNINMKNIIKTD